MRPPPHPITEAATSFLLPHNAFQCRSWGSFLSFSLPNSLWWCWDKLLCTRQPQTLISSHYEKTIP